MYPLKVLKGSKQWGVTMNAHDESGTIIFKSNGKPQTTTKHMADTTWNGQVQHLYYSDDHPQYPRYFKGMARILEEQGHNVTGLHAQCEKFKCHGMAVQCCCWNILFHSHNFINVKSLLKTHCEAAKFGVLFLPKFHCKLNFIEQVWGYAKHVYHKFPPSSRVEDVETNLQKALESVSITSMHK